MLLADMHIPKCGYVESHRRPVTKEEIARPVRMAKSFKSKYPFVTIVMQKAYVYRGFMLVNSHSNTWNTITS